ncbi:MAG: ribonuclease HI [Acidobacteriota bacterium]|jgi:ribonuclease HI|nr:ribonuclease HI [Acidobacteriota bacterium]
MEKRYCPAVGVIEQAHMKQVKVFTDGACKNNPGPGGYGVILQYGGNRRELSAGFRRTTNNRMEILAAIAGLEALKEPCQVLVYSDSQYLVNAMSKGWARKWRANGWKRNRTEKAVNPDLWERLLALCEIHKVSFEWVRGHAGHAENERCDELATTAATAGSLPADENYERTSR